MSFIAHIAAVCSANIFIQVCLKWLYKLLSPNKITLSSKTLMLKSDPSVLKFQQAVSLKEIAHTPDLDKSVFHKNLLLIICVGLNES